MKSRIKRYDRDLPLPEYKTAGAAAFDLAASKETRIPAKKVGYVPLNVTVEPPKGYFLILAARSSLHKRGLFMANGIGIVDPDFCGDGDELTAALYNFSAKSVTISLGERIMQGLYARIIRPRWKEVSSMKRKPRGGFGSTGHR